jgi:hypothetical protein
MSVTNPNHGKRGWDRAQSGPIGYAEHESEDSELFTAVELCFIVACVCGIIFRDSESCHKSSVALSVGGGASV